MTGPTRPTAPPPTPSLRSLATFILAGWAVICGLLLVLAAVEVIPLELVVLLAGALLLGDLVVLAIMSRSARPR